MNKRLSRNKKRKILFIVPCVIGLALLFVWVVQLLWNALIPEIVGWKAITYWQAFGILLLSKILFGGFRFKGRGGGRCDNRHFRSKWGHLTDDDRSKFRAEWKSRFTSMCKDQGKNEESQT